MKKLLSVGLIAAMAMGCSANKTTKGAGIGTLAGAAAGAAWGAARGDWKKGAAIGAASGAVIGGVSGAVMDKQDNDLRKAGIRTERDENGNLVVQMTGESLKFDTGKATLKPDGEALLDKLAGVISKYPENRIAIQGHTDNTGSNSVNTVLSQNRADRVKAYLISKGLPSRCVIASTGFGPDMPVANNNTADGRAMNRRVELKISVDKDEAEKNEAARERAK